MGTIFGQAGVHADPEGVRYFEYRIPSGLPGWCQVLDRYRHIYTSRMAFFSRHYSGSQVKAIDTGSGSGMFAQLDQ